MLVARGIAQHLNRIAFSLMLTVLATGCAQKDKNFAIDARYEAAPDLYIQSAEQGDVKKMMKLAQMYSAGKINYRRDYPQAVYWYTRAANQGIVSAMCELGFIYEHGQGDVEKDSDLAIGWYRQAAEQDNAYAQYRLANLLAQQAANVDGEVAIAAEQWFLKAERSAADCSDNALCTIVQQDLFNYHWRHQGLLTEKQKQLARQQLDHSLNLPGPDVE